jgi:hypothetical protein
LGGFFSVLVERVLAELKRERRGRERGEGREGEKGGGRERGGEHGESSRRV